MFYISDINNHPFQKIKERKYNKLINLCYKFKKVNIFYYYKSKYTHKRVITFYSNKWSMIINT